VLAGAFLAGAVTGVVVRTGLPGGADVPGPGAAAVTRTDPAPTAEQPGPSGVLAGGSTDPTTTLAVPSGDGASRRVPTCTPAPLATRAAAVLVVGLPDVTDASEPLAQAVTALGVGGVFLSDGNVESARQVTELVAGLRAAAPHLVVATDEESGRVANFRSLVGDGPSPRRMVERMTPDEVRRAAAETGGVLADLGVTVDLAPVLDLDGGPWDGVIGDRSFSAEPAVAAEYGLAFAAGLQDAGVAPTVKHFPGHGRSTDDSHVTSALVPADLADLRATDLVPFQHAVDAGAPVVMLNHLRYDALDPDLPASLSPQAYALLRDMGFDGVAMTDSVGMGAVNLTWDFPEAAVLAVAAGADAVLATDGNQATRMRDALVTAVESGALPEARLSEAAARVTALGGGDPWAMSCLEVSLPSLSVPAG